MSSKKNASGGTANGHALELEYRIAGLTALYQKYCRVPLSPYSFARELQVFIGRGGSLHYVLDQSTTGDTASPLLGFATVVNSNSLLENIFPVERFIVDEDLSEDKRLAVSVALVQSIITQANAELHHRHDDIWINVTFPKGANNLELVQPIYKALEMNGFTANQAPGRIIWMNWLKRSNLSQTTKIA